METGSYSGIQIVSGMPPMGDTIFMPCNASGAPGELNAFVLHALNLTTKTMPSRAALEPGYAIVQRSSLNLCFVVTVNGPYSPREALDRGLRAVLADKRIADARVMWLPLMGTGAAGLSLEESEAITLEALAASGWASRPGVQIYVSGPDDPGRSKAESAVPPAPPKPPEPDGDPETNASTFYASRDAWDSEWLRDLTPNSILFWIKNGAPHLNRLKRGHSIVLLAGQPSAQVGRREGAIVAIGVLAAGPDREFRDTNDNRRWPVLITHVFDREVLRRERVEALTGPLVKGSGGGVHAIARDQIEPLSRLLSDVGGPRTFPFDAAAAEAALARGQSIASALPAFPHIHEVGADSNDPTFDGASDYLSDAPAQDEDLLDRGNLAVALARRLHLIWCRHNKVESEADAPPDPRKVRRSQTSDDTFIIHVDAPWGGGKTTFANFVSQVLNPGGSKPRPAHFLYGQMDAGLTDEQRKTASFDGVFLGDYSATHWEPHPRPGRRPWIIVRSNAWRYQDVEPPWWQIYLDVAKAIRDATLEDFGRQWRVLFSPKATVSERGRAVVCLADALWRGARAQGLGVSYRIFNTRLLKQLALTLIPFAIMAVLWRIKPWNAVGDIARFVGLSIANIKATVEVLLIGVGLLGGGFAALGTVFSQSLSPDIDFSGETKRIGVGDPIARFRSTFAKMLALGRRPILLIVDDLDRCSPKNVVELLRGFQTILQSPRMFVMILGDRNWIETAHAVAHVEMKGVGVGAEANLGARFVEKVFQLSFVLPAMSKESLDRYTIAQLSGVHPVTGDAPSSAPLSELAMAVEAAASGSAPATEREAAVKTVLDAAERRGVDVAEVQAAASRRFTAETVGDIKLTRRTEKLLAGLAPLLPGNPRQIKRVINAFPLFAAVGAQYFGYEAPGPLSTPEGTAKWRQLALWVALSTEWPVTWRQLAKEPGRLDAAYAPTAQARDAALETLAAGKSEEAVAELRQDIRRLREESGLAGLLGDCAPKAATQAAMLFARTRVEPAAVFEFNQIIWEPGFDTGAVAALTSSEVPRA